MSPLAFRGAIPDDLLYDAEHDMWVRREGDEAVLRGKEAGAYASPASMYVKVSLLISACARRF